MIVKSLIGISGHGEELIGNTINRNRYVGNLLKLRTDNIPDLRVLTFSGKISSCNWELEKLHTSRIFEEIKTMTNSSSWDLLQDIQQRYKSAYTDEIKIYKDKNLQNINPILEKQKLYSEYLQILMSQIEEFEKEKDIEKDTHPSHSEYMKALQKYSEYNKALYSLDTRETNVILEDIETKKTIDGEPLQIICPQNDKMFQLKGKDTGDSVYYVLENLSEIQLKDGTIIPMGMIIHNGTLDPKYDEVFNKILEKKTFDDQLFYGIFKSKIESDELLFSDIITFFARLGVEVQNYIDTSCRDVTERMTEGKVRTIKRGETIGPVKHNNSKGKIYHAGKKTKRNKRKQKKSKKKRL